MDPFFGIFRHARFFKGKADDAGTVFPDDRKDPPAVFFFRVDGVYDHPSACGPEAGFDGLRIGGINLQGQIGHALDGADHILHQRRFIGAGKSDIDIQNIGAIVSLFNGALHDIVHIMFPESLLETFFSGRINALGLFRQDT